MNIVLHRRVETVVREEHLRCVVDAFRDLVADLTADALMVEVVADALMVEVVVDVLMVEVVADALMVEVVVDVLMVEVVVDVLMVEVVAENGCLLDAIEPRNIPITQVVLIGIHHVFLQKLLPLLLRWYLKQHLFKATRALQIMFLLPLVLSQQRSLVKLNHPLNIML
jgi:hypothetical protein